MARKSPNPLDLYEIEQIKVLKANGLTDYAIAKKVGRDRKTIQRCCMDPRNAEEIKVIQRKLAGFFEDLSVRLITSISDEDIERLNCYQRVIAAGIAVDKCRLIRNESTENISIDTVNRNIEETEERIMELEIKLSERHGVDYEAERVKLREKVLRKMGKSVENETLHEPKSELLENPENLTGESTAE
jgi:hypothetical protein